MRLRRERNRKDKEKNHQNVSLVCQVEHFASLIYLHTRINQRIPTCTARVLYYTKYFKTYVVRYKLSDDEMHATDLYVCA